MKPYTLSVDMDAPRDLVIELFSDPDNCPMWNQGFVSWTLVEGVQGQPGARAELAINKGKREFMMTETVTDNSLPDSISGTYDWGGNYNMLVNRFTLVNRFIELDADHTRWEATYTFALPTLRMKILALLMGRKALAQTRAQHLVTMKAFKAFCEDGTDIRDGSSG